MALAALIAAYSLAGAICLFVWGQFLWFGPYEYQARLQLGQTACAFS